MNRLKIIQIGVGHDHATPVLDTMLGMTDIYEIAGVIPTEEDTHCFAGRLRNVAQKTNILTTDDLDAIQPDAVIVETEDEYLTKYAQFAVDKGYPVHMDKPGSPDLGAFEKLIQTAKEKRLPFHLGYMYRFNPMVMQALRKIKNGELGEIYAVEAHMDCLHGAEKRQWLAKYPGGMTFYLGCHLIDIVYSVLGEPDEVIPLNASSHFDGVESEDEGFVVFRYGNGISFIKTTAVEPGGYLRRQIVFCGERGTIEIKPIEQNISPIMMQADSREVYTADNEREGWDAAGKHERSAPFHRYRTMMQDFAEIVRGNKPNAYPYDYELGLFRLLMRACGR